MNRCDQLGVCQDKPMMCQGCKPAAKIEHFFWAYSPRQPDINETPLSMEEIAVGYEKAIFR